MNFNFPPKSNLKLSITEKRYKTLFLEIKLANWLNNIWPFIFLTASSVVYRGLRNDFDACCSSWSLSGTFVKSFGNGIAKKPWQWHCQNALEMTLPKSLGNDIAKKLWKWHCQKALTMILPKFEKTWIDFRRLKKTWKDLKILKDASVLRHIYQIALTRGHRLNHFSVLLF